MGRLKQICAAFAFLAIAMFATSTHAQRWKATPPPPPAAPESPAAPADSQPWREAKERLPAPDNPASVIRERTWYGWQTLIADTLGIGLIVFGDESDATLVGIGTLGLGAPLVHFAHANVDAGLISLAIRAGSIGLLVLGGAFIGNAIFDDGNGNETGSSFGAVFIIASLVGGLTGLILDASVLGYDIKTRKKDYATTSVAPWVDPDRGNYGLHVRLAL